MRKSIILVYTMGKVGSSTIYATIKDLLRSAVIFHVHFLKSWGIKLAEDFSGNDRQTETAIKINNWIANGNRKIKIVTLVRDPIAREISDLFQNLDYFVKHGVVQGYDDSSLIEGFKNKKKDFPSLWIDNEFCKFLNCDISDLKIVDEEKYIIRKFGNIDLLLIKLESGDETIEKAVGEFLKLGKVKLVNKNISKEKDISQLRQNFLSKITFDKAEIDTIYNQKWVRTFYSEKEINGFKNKWKNWNTH